jgi:hypothetical protein
MWALMISPGFKSELRSTARAVIEAAPRLPQWRFLGSKPSKNWDYVFELQRDRGETVRINASDWTFVLGSGFYASKPQ